MNSSVARPLLQRTFTLNNGTVMPGLGLGTWNTKPVDIHTAIISAIQAGYRHIDCAKIYGNEKEVGAALADAMRQGLVTRSELWITSKLWNTHHSRAEVEEQLDSTLSDLQLSYVDLYLIHWPVNCSKEDRRTALPATQPQPSLQETWQGMMDVYEKKKVRAIGVSNFSISKLETILKDHPSVIPAVNQCELHPLLRQDELKQWCGSKGIHMTAYSPLGSPGIAAESAPSLMQNAVVQRLGGKCAARTPARVLLAWALQRGTSVIPKSSNPVNIQSNADLGFELSEEEMAELSTLPMQHRYIQGNFFTHPEGWYPRVEDLWA